jgi:hypothetical protein
VAALAEAVRLAWRRHPAAAWLGLSLVGGALPYAFTHFERRYRLPVCPLLFLLAVQLSLATAAALTTRLRRASPEAPAGLGEPRRAA